MVVVGGLCYTLVIDCRWPVGPNKWKRRERWKLHQEGWAQVVVQSKLRSLHNFDREGSE